MKKSILKRIRKFKKKYRIYRHWNYENFPAKQVAPLTADEKKAVDAVWRDKRFLNNYKWHALFKTARGTLEPEMVPCDVFYMKMLQKLNNTSLSKAWNDKCFTAKIYSGLPIPESLVYCIDNGFYDTDYNYLSSAEAVARLQQADTQVIVKPSLASRIGKGFEKLRTEELTENSLEKIAKARKGNCVFQRLLKQSEQFAAFNPDSVNIIRVNALRLESEIVILNATVRFGAPGQATDVYKDAKGEEQLNLLGIDRSGCLMDRVYHIDGSWENAADYGFVPGTPVEGFDEVLSLAKTAMKRLRHFNLVAFDITVDSNYHPVLIEANTGNPGIFGYQFVHGPLFGEYFDRVMEVYFK